MTHLCSKRAIALTASVVAATIVTAAPPVASVGLLPGDRAVRPATNSQSDLSVAKGGEIYLAAWTDYRARSAGSQSQQSDADVFGVRIDATGNLIDAQPFLLAGGMGFQQRPTVAWNGENWLVLYQSQDPSGGYYDTFIRAVRVSGAGELLDDTPLAFPSDLFSPSTIGLTVSGQGGQWLVARCVYHNDGYGTFLAGQRISSGGQLLDPAPVMLNDWVYGALTVIPSNGEYMVIGPDWNNGSQLKGRRIGTNLQPIAASFNLPAGTMSVAGNGSELYITWIRDFVNLVGSRMTTTGAVLNPTGTLLVNNFSGTPMLTHDGTNWWFGWSVSNWCRTMRINPNGAVLDPGGVQLPIVVTGSVNSLYSPQLQPIEGGGVLFAWNDWREALGSDSNHFVLPVTAANVGGAESCISLSTTNQRNPDFANGPSGTSAVVYVSEAANDDRVLVQFLNAVGQPTTSEPIEVYRGPSVGRAGIAYNGSIYMISFDAGTVGSNPGGVKARRMNSDGTFIDGSYFDVMPGFNSDIEALGQNFLIGCARYGTYPQYIFLYGNRVDGQSGAVLDGSSGMYLGGNYVSGAVRVRTDGAQWFVCAHSQWTHDSSQGDAIMARVPAVGAPAQAGNPTPVAGGSGDLDIAWSGGRYLLVWRMNSLSNANNYIAGRIMNADGTFPPGYLTIAEAPGRQLRPTVSWDGETFIVAWDDQRNQASFYDARTDIYATRVSETGVVLDSPAFPVIRTRDGDAGAALLSLESGVTLAAGACFLNDADHDSYRIAVARIGDLPQTPGDVDHDGDVDLTDLAQLLASFGACNGDLAYLAAADFDADGCIALSDLATLLANYGL